jgi:beta-glucosidase
LNGDWTLGVVGIDRSNLFLDGKHILDYDTNLQTGDFFFGWCHEARTVVVKGLEKGKRYRLELRCWPSDKLRSLAVKMSAGFMVGASPVLREDEAVADAVSLARTSDVAIVIVGLNKNYESEGFDRLDMKWV